MNEAILRGEIYYANLDPAIGSEQSGNRPVLIIQNDTGNKFGPTVIVASITSKMKPKLPTHLELPKFSGLLSESVILFEQLRTIDKKRLNAKIATLDKTTLRLVDTALMTSLGLRREVKNPLVMSLCKVCAQTFMDAHGHTLRRVNRNQAAKENCTMCSIRSGYDYEIIRK